MVILQGESASTGAFLSSLLVLGVLATLVAIGYSRMKYFRLSEKRTGQKQEARRQWFEDTPATVMIREGDAEESVFESISNGLAAARDERVGSAQPDGTVTVWAALYDAWHDLRADVGRRFDGIPRIVPALGMLAALVFLFGTAAIYTEAIVTAITEGSSSPPDLLAVPRFLFDLTVSVLGTFGDLAALVPFGGMLFSLALTLGMMLAEWVYHHYYLIALGLVIVMASIAGLDKRVPHQEVDTRLYYHRRDIVLETTGALVVIWAAAALPTVAGRALSSTAMGGVIDTAAVGSVLGALASLGVTGYFALYAARSLRSRVEHAATINWAGGPDRALGAYLLARYSAVGLAALAVPLVVVFAAVLLLDGRLLRILGAIGAAPWPVQASVVLAVGGGLLIGGYETRQRWPELARAVRKALASQGVRLLIFRKALTAVGMVVGATIGWALLGIQFALWIGVLVGVLVYSLYTLSLKARYRTDMLDMSLPSMRARVARCGHMQIAGHDQFVVDIAGEKFVRSDLEECATDAAAVGVAAVDPDADRPPTLAEHYGEALFRFGFADPDARDTKVDNMVRKAGLRRPRDEHRVELDSLREDLTDEYPEDRAERWLDKFRNLELLYPVGDGYVEYRPENDPWRGRSS